MQVTGRETDVYVRIGPGRSLLGWIILGLIAGWLAGKLARGRGFGCIGDILLGLIGSVVGAAIIQTAFAYVRKNTTIDPLDISIYVGMVLIVIQASRGRRPWIGSR